jgi:hypothetical protein
VRASTRLTEAAKALATRDHVRGISGPSALSNSKAVSSYVLSTHVLEHDIPVLNLILNVVVININMFSALVVALA